MLKNKFEFVFKHYLSDKAKFDNAPPPRKDSDFDSFEILKNVLRDELKAASNLPSTYKFKGSVGLGRKAEIPHLCIFDTEITDSAQRGYYIVYLFNSDMSAVYLSLNQGWTNFRDTYGAPLGLKKIQENARLAQKFVDSKSFSFDSITLNASSGDLGEGYEMGNICSKRYLKDQVPTDDQIIEDFKQLIEVYKELRHYIESGILDIPYKRTEMEYQAAIQRAKPKEYPAAPIPKKDKHRLGEREAWKRDAGYAMTALIKAKFRCENDPAHETFVVQNAQHSFMEAHHLIPIRYQDAFDFSLDVPQNIISLCPNCHRKFHKAQTEDKKEMIVKFHRKREILLRNMKIPIALPKLISYYKARDLAEEPDEE